MLKKQAIAIAHTLSNPSKMPGLSYSLPIAACKVGSKLRKQPGTVCSKCYAGRGRYAWNPTLEAQEKRLAAISHPQWVEAMVTLIGRAPVPYFRWQDSGDIQGLRHLEKICEIAARLPDVHFWLPSREYGVIAAWQDQRTGHPENLVVRVASPKIDSGPLAFPWHTSTVHDKREPIGHRCPAPTQGGKCGDCRACWDRSIPNVSYKLH